VDAASARESGPRVTGKHNTWESSNNAQRLWHNGPGATREQARARSTGETNRGTATPAVFLGQFPRVPFAPFFSFALLVRVEARCLATRTARNFVLPCTFVIDAEAERGRAGKRDKSFLGGGRNAGKSYEMAVSAACTK